MNKAKYSVFSYDGYENECLMAEFDTLAEAQADCDARNEAEGPKRTGDVEDLYYVVAEPEPEDPWQYLNLGFGTEYGFGEQWKREVDAREKVGSILRLYIVHRTDRPEEYIVTASVIHNGYEEYDQTLHNEKFPSLHDAQQAAERWLTQNPQSVTCLDVGFDLRLDDRKILLPKSGVCYYRYETQDGETRHIRAQSKLVGEILRASGYKVKFKKEAS